MLSVSCLVHSLFALATLSLAAPAPAPAPLNDIKKRQGQEGAHNDYSCRSQAHPNPVVFLHGLGATYYEDLNYLEAYLKNLGYCTFSLTYGDYPQFPYVGGLKAISESSQEIATFTKDVKARTGASKIDIVGHSEGAFQALYVPKFTGISTTIDNIVSIAPPVHGTTFGGLYRFSYIGGNLTRELTGEILKTVGCPACDDLGPGGPAVNRLNDGKPIVQPGNKVTIIASKFDELVTPLSTTRVYEQGARYVLIQDVCPFDLVGHIGEAYDLNVWNLVVNALNNTPNRKFICTVGSPGR